MFRNRMNKLDRMKAFGMINCKEGDEPLTQEDLDAAVATAVAAANEANSVSSAGLKDKNTQLLETLAANKTALASIDGVDVPELLALKEKIAGDEILSLLAEGKSSEALEKHTERMAVNHTAEITTLTDQLTAATDAGTVDRSQLHGLLIDGEAMKAFVTAKGRETALPDIVLRAKQIFKVERNETTGQNEVLARGTNGKLLQGEKGNLTFPEWAESLKKTAPHLFPDSESGFATGGENTDGTPGGDAELLAAAEKGAGALRDLKNKRKAAKKAA